MGKIKPTSVQLPNESYVIKLIAVSTVAKALRSVLSAQGDMDAAAVRTDVAPRDALKAFHPHTSQLGSRGIW